jgi:WD40 repeat protein
MSRTIPSKNNHHGYKCVGSPVSLRRQVSSVILLLSVICAPVRGLAQTKEQDKRGIGIPSGTRQTSAPATTAAAGGRPELILQTGHTKSVNAIAFSPDNRWLASGGKDNVIKIWDLTTGNVLRTLYGHSSNVNALAVSPDGKLLASAVGTLTTSGI